jgi:ATP/maltotriose-dependent transcriptional regulator MalT
MTSSDDALPPAAPRSPLPADELAELRRLLQQQRDLLQQCARDLVAIDRRLYSLQNVAAHAASRAWVVPLTSRELQVLALVAANLSNPEISRALKIKPGTVKNHLTSIIGKLLVKDRSQAVARAQTLGII